MKKIILIITAILTLLLCSCGDPDASKNSKTLSAPPSLTVYVGEEKYEITPSVNEWSYKTKSGNTVSEIVDKLHPLDALMQDHTPVIDTSDTCEATFMFDVLPNSVSAQCWSDECRGHTYKEGKEFMIKDMTATLHEGGYIYEITAVWESSNLYSGSASYSFCTK